MTKKKAKADNIRTGNQMLAVSGYGPEVFPEVDAVAEQYGLPNAPPDYSFREQWREAVDWYLIHQQWQDPEIGNRGKPSEQADHFEALKNAAEEMEKVLGKLTADRQFKVQQQWGERPPYGDPGDRDWKTRMLNDAAALKWAAASASKELPKKYGNDAWWWFLQALVGIWKDGGKEVPQSLTFADRETGREQYPNEIAQFVMDCVRVAGITPDEKSDAAIGSSLKRLLKYESQ